MKGRYWIAFWLLCFIIATGVVAVRTQQGYALAAELGRLRDQRVSLEAQKSDLERRIRQQTSRAVLGPIVTARLGLVPPGDTSIVVFCVSEPGRPCPDAVKP